MLLKMGALVLLVMLCMVGCGTCSRCASTPASKRAGVHSQLPHYSPPAHYPLPTHSLSCAVNGSANIVLFLTDDMDLMLGSWGALNKTQRLLADEGATATNWMIHTPVCCPSRAELLTGRYFHNLRVAKPTDRGCMHVNVSAKDSAFYDQYYFAPHLQQAGYTVGIFGKHLNNYNPACPPPGVDRWLANGGGNYFSPQFSWASAGTSPATASSLFHRPRT